MMENQDDQSGGHVASEQHAEAESEQQQQQQQEVAAKKEEKPRPRSESWLSKLGKSVAGAAKKVGVGAKKLGRDIGKSTKKVFAKKQHPETQGGQQKSSGSATAAEGTASTPPEKHGRAKFPARGMRCATAYGDGIIAHVNPQDGRAVVHLDWHLADGKPACAYVAVELLRRPVPKFLKGAGKALHKVGDVFAGENGLFGKNTRAKIGNSTKKVIHDIDQAVDKAASAIVKAADKVFKKRSPSQPKDMETELSQETETEEKVPESKEETVEEPEEEGENPYAAAQSAE